MATTEESFIYRLPDELLLHVARQLRPRRRLATLGPLRSLSRTSKKLHSIAQEELYAGAWLPVSCGCHPRVNAAVQLLRTLLQRPERAAKVKKLRFSIVRRRVDELYREKQFDLDGIRAQCFKRLTALGYLEGHPWWTSLANDVESAYVGVLLSLLPNLETLHFTVREHHRGWPTLEPMSALFGMSTAPDAVVAALKNVRKLSTQDYGFMRDVSISKLKQLSLTRLDTGTVLRLNGPNSLPGATELQELCVGVSVQLLEAMYMHEMRVCLRDLFEALGCKKLKTLRIMLFNDAYCLGLTPVFSIQYFMKQLEPVLPTLRTLEIVLDFDDESTEWAWFFTQCEDPIESFEKLPVLEHLKLPQEFLFKYGGDRGISPVNIPKSLKSLGIVAPDHDIIEWVMKLLTLDDSSNVGLKTFVLHCRDGLIGPASDFASNVSPVWVELFDSYGIQSFLCDGRDGEKVSLTKLYELDPEDAWEDEEEDEADEDDDDDDDMPSLEDPDSVQDELDREMYIAEVD
ncbi:hypothetical protein P280DRAFT_471908 [Massarina eburnea CBS 473.64]|uniref:F-box domain-containing protein n=1 Tax=Massarina eburnea CBS 473.64 TaxID=1395130 RepID=A0A6A6RQ63_9PLEO|nr:hypothetical protein P280DRAFT_471908 [Massarina eburnea CBS 473.64]